MENSNADRSAQDFEFGVDVRDESRLRQDEEWAEAVADGRGHVSHRELTMLNAPQFCKAILDYELIEQLVEALYGKKSILSKITPEILQIIVEFAMPGHGPIVNSCIIKRNISPLLFANKMESSCSIAGLTFPFRICIRKRPMLEFEKGYGAYDVCNTKTKNHITLHEGKLSRSGRQLSMTHYEYVFDEVYGEQASNLDVCRRSVEPLLSWAVRGNQSSLMCFGQTGTGKTYTLYGALEYISTRLVSKTLRLTFYEVHGKKCYDLLSNRRVIHLRSDANDVMHVRGAKSVTIAGLQSAHELIAVLKEALELRSSEMTERNPISSRSHAVCTIEIASSEHDSVIATGATASRKPVSLAEYMMNKQPQPPATTTATSSSPSASAESETVAELPEHPARTSEKYLEGGEEGGRSGSQSTATSVTPSPEPDSEEGSGPIESSSSTTDVFSGCGRITLVDLAGSERNYETTKMTAQQHKESAEINFALMALKDCFRAYHQQLAAVAAVTTTTTGAQAAFNGLSHVETVVDVSGHESHIITAHSSANAAAGAGSNTIKDGSAAINSENDITTIASTSAASPAVRVPYRASLLTKVLKDCFTLDAVHRTTIIATVSPTAVDLQHTLNTLSHVVLMSPTLHQLVDRLTVEVPMVTGSALSTTPVSQWTVEQVDSWLGIAENGRFSHVVLPPKTDGAKLLLLTATNLAEMFLAQQNVSRREKEGAAWVVSAAEETERQNDIATALWSAVRREQQSALVKIKVAKEKASNASSDLGRFTLGF